GNVIGQVDAPNVISGNAQSGVFLFGTAGNGGHDTVQGNQIGTNSSAVAPVPNGSNGVFIYGTSGSLINSNTISGNAQAGVSIFSPATSAIAARNTMSSNRIGVGAGGMALGNQSDGVAILSGEYNTIGGTTPGSGNVISGNLGNGVLI